MVCEVPSSANLAQQKAKGVLLVCQAILTVLRRYLNHHHEMPECVQMWPHHAVNTIRTKGGSRKKSDRVPTINNYTQIHVIW